MKYRVEKEEWYPMYILSHDRPNLYPTLELSEEFFLKWSNLQVEWEDMQAKIETMLRG